MSVYTPSQGGVYFFSPGCIEIGRVKLMKRLLSVLISSVLVWCAVCFSMTGATTKQPDFIRYAEFNVTSPALEKALEADILSQNEDVKINWVEVLAVLGASYGGDFGRYRASDMDGILTQLRDGKSVSELTRGMKYYDYYRQVYGAVLDGFVGKYTEYGFDEQGNVTETETYGLKVCSPLAKNFSYSHYDDFGASRTYGYARQHLGHDMMCAVGTPVIAVEDGTVEVMGWNEYGGWRIGIRSNDRRRYYYYAHLRQNRPFHEGLSEGMTVHAGDVIGYAGRTGYSKTENTNNIETPHLHFGLELIFDESQKECDNEIWIDLYAITLLLEQHRSEVVRVAETKEFYAPRQKLSSNSSG